MYFLTHTPPEKLSRPPAPARPLRPGVMNSRITTHKSDITAMCHSSRVNVLERLCRALAAPGRNPLETMMDPPVIEAIIDAQDWGRGTQKNYWVALYNIAKAQPVGWLRREEVMEAYHEKFIELSHDLREESLLQEKTEREKAGWMDYHEIRAFGAAFVKRDDIAVDNRIIVGLFTLLPPARLDYTDLEIRDAPTTIGPDTPNHVFLTPYYSGSYVYIAKHKSSGSAGAIHHALPPALCDLFQQFKRENPGALCLPIKPHRLGARLKDLFVRYAPGNKPVTANIIRHSKATEDCVGMPVLKNLVHYADSMKHDVLTHLMYAKK